MGKSIKNWFDFIGNGDSVTFHIDLENPKGKIEKLIDLYKEISLIFTHRHDEITSKFRLKENEKNAVRFGVICTKNVQLQKFVDILNSDLQLKNLYRKIEETLLTGNLLILKLIQREGITIPGYDLNAFITDPSRYKEDIMHLIIGFWGYRHIYILDDVIMSEIPASVYIADEYEIIDLVKKWVDGLDLIDVSKM